MARIFLGRTTELSPPAVKSIITIAIQKAVAILDREGAVKGVELDILPDGSWGAFLIAEGVGLESQDAPAPEDWEEKMTRELGV